MKILNLKIKDPNDLLIRDIPFKENGISFIFGDIKTPKNDKGSLNSLGKTLLLKLIDYIYGANEDPNVVKKVIHNYKLEATILYNKKKYLITRILGSSENIYINNIKYSLSEFKIFFNIERELIRKQFLLEPKKNLIGNMKNPIEGDVVSFLKLLEINEILENIKSIYTSQDKIKLHKASKKEATRFYYQDYEKKLKIDNKKIDHEVFIIEKEKEKLEKYLQKLSSDIQNLNISSYRENIIEEYSEKTQRLKLTKKTIEKNKQEIIRLKSFIEDSNKIDITASHLIEIFKQTKIQIPEMICKELKEVEEFHRKVYDERKEFLENKSNALNDELSNLKNYLAELSSEVDELGNVISENKIYKESIKLYEINSSKLQNIKYKEGQLSQIKNFNSEIVDEDSNLDNYFSLSKSKLETEYNEIIKKYRDFLYTLTKNIYDEDVVAYFNLSIKKKHQTARPVKFEFDITGDTGEGVGKVKNIMTDILIFNFTSVLDFLFQDSSCYNGVDPRQLIGLFHEIENIAVNKNKQAILAVNKYQFGNFYTNISDFIVQNTSIELSEVDKLLKFNFD